MCIAYSMLIIFIKHLQNLFMYFYSSTVYSLAVFLNDFADNLLYIYCFPATCGLVNWCVTTGRAWCCVICIHVQINKMGTHKWKNCSESLLSVYRLLMYILNFKQMLYKLHLPDMLHCHEALYCFCLLPSTVKVKGFSFIILTEKNEKTSKAMNFSPPLG